MRCMQVACACTFTCHALCGAHADKACIPCPATWPGACTYFILYLMHPCQPMGQRKHMHARCAPYAHAHMSARRLAWTAHEATVMPDARAGVFMFLRVDGSYVWALDRCTRGMARHLSQVKH